VYIPGGVYPPYTRVVYTRVYLSHPGYTTRMYLSHPGYTSGVHASPYRVPQGGHASPYRVPQGVPCWVCTTRVPCWVCTTCVPPWVYLPGYASLYRVYRRVWSPLLARVPETSDHALLVYLHIYQLLVER